MVVEAPAIVNDLTVLATEGGGGEGLDYFMVE